MLISVQKVQCGMCMQSVLKVQYGMCMYSDPCRSQFPRRAAVVNYFADGVWSDTEEPLLNGVPAVPKGEKIDGQFFPVVYDPAWMV